MKKIFLFSGLGADKRVFSKLDLEEFEIVHIDWLVPLKNESLSSYVNRLAKYYHIPKSGANVLGVSFGGMCVVELAKTYNLNKTVLISTAKSSFELPSFYKLFQFLPLYKLFPSTLITIPTKIHHLMFGVKNDLDKEMLNSIIRDSNPHFFKWAVDVILNWKDSKIPKEFLHIHGDEDRIIPIIKCKSVNIIKGGGHLITLTHHNEISILINEYSRLVVSF